MDFLVIGAQKAGTTEFQRILRHHPELQLADRKEVHFFDNDASFVSEVDYSHYEAEWSEPQLGRLRGENTPAYLYWKPVAQRIAAFRPGTKLIAILRNPMERAFSHWQMTRRKGQENLSFADAIRLEPDRLAATPTGQHLTFSYADRGRYATQLRRFLGLFPRGNLLVLRSEDLRAAPQQTFDQVTNFLGVARSRFRPRRKPTRIRYTDPIPTADFDFLAAELEPEIAALESLLGWDLADWRRRPTGNAKESR